MSLSCCGGHQERRPGRSGTRASLGSVREGRPCPSLSPGVPLGVRRLLPGTLRLPFCSDTVPQVPEPPARPGRAATFKFTAGSSIPTRRKAPERRPRGLLGSELGNKLPGPARRVAPAPTA